jgi:hypothetical protein
MSGLLVRPGRRIRAMPQKTSGELRMLLYVGRFRRPLMRKGLIAERSRQDTATNKKSPKHLHTRVAQSPEVMRRYFAVSCSLGPRCSARGVPP